MGKRQTAAARALVQGLAAAQRMERDVGAHDDRRVSLFEQQQTTYKTVLLGGRGAGVPVRTAAHQLPSSRVCLAAHLPPRPPVCLAQSFTTCTSSDNGLIHRSTYQDARLASVRGSQRCTTAGWSLAVASDESHTHANVSRSARPRFESVVTRALAGKSSGVVWWAAR